MRGKGDGIFSRLRRALRRGGERKQPDATGQPAPAVLTPRAEPSQSAGIPAPTAGRDRIIRLFISSTFRDMQAERELLI